MDPRTAYYINQAVGGLGDLIEPLYRGGFHVQQGHGIGSFLSGLFLIVQPILVSRAKAVGRETVAAGANILSDIAAQKSNPKQIIAVRITQSTNTLVSRLRDRGRKRKSTTRDIFS